MPLHGEAERKTYIRHVAIAKGVWIARHDILGENCVQKTYELWDAKTRSLSPSPGCSTNLITRTSPRYGRPIRPRSSWLRHSGHARL